LVGKTTSSIGTSGFVASASGMSATNSGSESANFNRLASDGVVVQFRRSDTIVGSVAVTTTTTAYNTSSDYRLKYNVVPIVNGLATISALKPSSYKWLANDSNGEGFIAHELQQIIPLAVSGEKDAVNEDGSIKAQGVDYSKIVVHLVAAIQELSAKVAALEGK